MRNRLISSAVCLGLLLGTLGLFCAESTPDLVATRYHAARRTAQFYRQAAASRVIRSQVVAPVTVPAEKVDVAPQPPKKRLTSGDKSLVR